MAIENFLYKPEFYYWFLIPTIVTVFVFIKSILILSRKRNWLNWILTIGIILSILFSEYMLYVVFFLSAWPTYLPHIIIVFALIVYGIQVYANKKHSR